MYKYSSEFKLEIFKYCIESHHSSYDTEKHFNIPVVNIKIWIKKYNKNDIKGLIKNKISSYNIEFKQKVIDPEI